MKIFILFVVMYVGNYVTVEKVGDFDARRECEYAALQVRSAAKESGNAISIGAACIEVIKGRE